MPVSEQQTPIVEVSCKSIVPPVWRELTDKFNFSGNKFSVFAIHIPEFYNHLVWCTHLLSEEERAKSGRFFKAEDRNRYIISKAILRTIAGRYLQIPAAELRFAEGENKKPFIEGHQNLCFNISHTLNMTVIAINDVNIGIDIEFVNHQLDYAEIMGSVFSDSEKKEVEKAAKPLDIFYGYWTRKEALIKGTGKGIDEDFRLFSCLDGSYPVNGRLIGAAQNWTIQTFNLKQDLICSLAFPTNLQAQPLFFTVTDRFISMSIAP